MDQGCLGHIFLEVNSHSVPKDKHRTFEKLLKIKNLTKNVSPNIYCMLTTKYRATYFHINNIYIKASIKYRTNVTL